MIARLDLWLGLGVRDHRNQASTSRGGSPWRAKEKTDGAGSARRYDLVSRGGRPGTYRSKSTSEQTQQCAKAVEDQKQQEEEKPLELRGDIEFAGAFQKLLREVAANAPGALHRDPVIASTEFSSLYSPAEIVSGISAAEDTGLSVEQGVICFVMLSAAIEAELQKRGGLLQRLKTKLTPRQGARAHTHSVMFNYVCERPPGGHMPNLEAFRLFAKGYNENVAQNAKTARRAALGASAGG